jgi:hypothetical protein
VSGRFNKLVAIMFADDLLLLIRKSAFPLADDLFLIAEAPHHLQLLLDATQEFYTSISASLSAFKSKWSGSHAATPWSIDLTLAETDEEELESLATACRHSVEESPFPRPRQSTILPPGLGCASGRGAK